MIMRTILILKIIFLTILAMGQDKNNFVKITGLVNDNSARPIPSAEITISTSCGDILIILTNSDGSFFNDSIPTCQSYQIDVSRASFYSKRFMINFSQLDKDTTLVCTLDSIPTQKNYCPYFTFSKNSSKIKTEEMACLDDGADFLLSQPEIRIRLIGCQNINESTNTGLKRARHISKYLIKKGIDKNRLVISSQNDCNCKSSKTTEYCVKAEIITN
jgi:hypothetical protein